MLTTSPLSRYATVLVAGAGDVGQRVARQLAGRGHRVLALRRSEVAQGDDGVHWLRGDLTRPETLANLPAVDALVFAATPDRRDEAAYRAVFVDGLRHLLAALPSRPARTVFVSSSAVYGEHGEGWVDERTPTAPPGFNGRVLLEAERLLGEGDVVVRLAGLYGPGRTQLFERLREGKAVVPRGKGVYANRIHVDDAAAALVHVLTLDAPERVYVGVDDTPLPIDALYDHLAGLLGAPLPGDGPSPAGVGSKRLSNARLRASGFRCRWPDAREGYAALLV
ncbi:NAD-dependent epimerase/dehydratase family protein [Luteibacter sp. PPL201]|jgi:nucleoside-diphosphate-sugar epimerase|uniref:NAD-dependent epimerase/dehydratase family protein n=1 Tax=Luteibacter sahnii TaxID=3021977 RepID=A0ABT6B727_9GAMM|nr:NAD-dependent epimerase/dehydratase family protein [Luteibacter sp. PPL193]MDY1548161.1 NAD-dependent epimerase/dehydratase family protein [Luteibacter sp. PPL193]